MSPFEIDLERDRAQWSERSGEDQGLIYWVLSSLMVAEERITTKFSGLVGAYGAEEIREFALGGLTRRLDIIGVPLSSLSGTAARL